MGIGELKYGNIKDQIEQSMFKNTRENKVEFVVCAGGGAGKLHIRKNHTTCWCGRQWTQVVDGSPDIDRCRKCLRSLPRGGRAVTCECWTLDWTLWRFWYKKHAVVLKGFRGDLGPGCLLGRPQQVGTSFHLSGSRGAPGWWDKCWAKWIKRLQVEKQPVGGTSARVWPRGLYKRLQVGEATACHVVKFGQVAGEAPAGCCVLRGVGRRGKVSWGNCGGDPHLSPTTGPCG